MIFDSLENISGYFGLGSRFQMGLEYLVRCTPDTTDCRTELLPDDALYVVVQRLVTRPAAERQFEAHRRYADIQYLISGEELVWWRRTNLLTETVPYRADKDAVLYALEEPEVSLKFMPGNFAIFLPTDGHAPGIAAGSPSAVLKAVVKVRLD